MAALTSEPHDHQERHVEAKGAGESEPPETARRLPITSVDLGDEIFKVVEENTIGLYPEGNYLPDNELKKLLTKDRIRHAIDCYCEVFPTCEDRRNVMASLMKQHFNDTSLESYELNASYFQHSLWKSKTIKDFKTERLPFTLPMFDKDIFKYEFDKKQPLPFMVSEEVYTPPRSGHFNEIKCVEMLASKQNQVETSGKTVRVALKRLKKIGDPGYDIRKEWEREARAHQQLNRLNKRNLIQAIAAYRQIATNRQLDEYYLVLEWANGGSLFDFWKNNPEPQVDSPDVGKARRRVKEMLEQLCGLAEALEAMHTTRARPLGDSAKSSASNSPRLRSQKTAAWKEDTPDNGGPYVDSLSLPTFNIGFEEDSGGNIAIPSISISSEPSSLKATENLDSLNWRHGDIKPENILRLIRENQDGILGTLKLADLGRAQQHQFVTSMRDTNENELWRTRWYEPPDLEKKNHEEAQGKISRLFDIWYMGCVVFETVLWLLYGYKSHDVFLRANGFTTGEKGATPYWRKRRDGSYGLTEAVTGWMEHILEHDLERDGVIGDLIRLTRDRLLKIKLPPNSDLYAKGFRTNAKDLKQQLNSILERAGGDENYAFSGEDRTSMSLPNFTNSATKKSLQSTSESLLSAEDARGKITPEDPLFVESILQRRKFGRQELELCRECRDISSLNTDISRQMDMVEANSTGSACRLCEVIYTAAKGHNSTSHDGINNISLTRSGENFVLEGTNQKFLRLIETAQHTTLPLAAPELASLTRYPDPNPADLESFMKLPKAWLQDCDTNHRDICALKDTYLLPTRLISVESLENPKIVATADMLKRNPSDVRYVALSHKWGNMPHEATTTRKNLKEREKRIPMSQLPLSFKNAIVITNALGCKYLWIDSLCILQGSDGDFNEEADKMQTTFNGAYCVLAACSAQSAVDGFLQNRESRFKCVEIDGIFVSPVTNDFERDVLQSPLARRGWVLQERAMACRTIYFTGNQTYWECGHGIRSETLAKLRKQVSLDKIAFLGDPNFPDYAIRSSSTVGDQIKLFIDLFQRYTRLEFSHPEDRPIAIDGLMERMTLAFKTRSLAGIFKTFWGRCLLWRRADNAGPLKKISPGTHSRRTPPTWSWMAFDGAISFIEPGGGQVSWNDAEVELPLAKLTGGQASWLQTSCQDDSVAIQAKAIDFDIPANASESEAYIYYDDSTISTAKCVIVGTDKNHVNGASMKKNYVLIVKPLLDVLGTTSYERCGVGYILGKYIRLDNLSVSVLIE
ncbi:hypothetical protein BOTNAR_0398g00040 [Botryotinia narcissicola]|uniref:Protein kinase domain-containing protein n=1 Tax=Botryotinia narcissicola TaxID=278944 RepID=A0A4Z1HNL0_9HELO|nr:hypothetical protein BOTNAR_0398g00040 [Botryotinia narcissicola]